MKNLILSTSFSILLLFGLMEIVSAQDSTLPLLEENSVDDVYSVLVSLLQEGKFQEALPYLDRILETEPNNVPILLNKGSVLIALDRSDESITYFDRLLKIEPNNIKGLSSKAAALANMGKTQNALDLYDKILSIDKDNKKIMNEKARLLSLTKTVSVDGNWIGEESDEHKYDIHLRVTVRTPEGELVSVIETKTGRYLPVSFTDEIFDTFFEKEDVEINGEKFEIAKHAENYYASNNAIGNFFFEVTMNNYSIHIFEVFAPHVSVEVGDELYVEWTVVRKVV